MPEPLLMRYMQPLLAGRRAECFELVDQAVGHGQAAADLICNIVWPAMAQVERLYKDDRINTAVEHMACRINRTVADQLQAHLPKSERKNKRVLVECAVDQQEELGAQMVADLLQADGWDVFLMGGGVPDDEVLATVGELRPQVLLIFGTLPTSVSQTRQQIELIREVGACPTMNIVVSGGIFNRADGLWEEVGADVFAPSAREVVQIVNKLQPRTPQPPRLGIVKKRRRRRRVAV